MVALATTAFAQQAIFNPTQCEGRTAGDCNDLMAALRVPPEEREKTLLTRAIQRLAEHDLDGAIAEYREVTMVNSGSVLAYSNLGVLEGVGHKWAEAAVDLRRAVTLAPGSGELHPMLIVALAKSGDCKGATAAVANARALPEAPRVDEAEQLVKSLCP